MKAMIFAAGLGTRLAPLTDTCPKALIEVGGRPMLRRAIERLRDAGVSEITVNVHHHAGMIKDYIAANDFGVAIRVSDESSCLLDTGGGVVKAASMLRGDGPVVLYNADIFTDFPLREMMECHCTSGADVTLLADSRETSRYLLFDASGRMTGWRNVSTGETRSPFPAEVTDRSRQLAFGGVHIINPCVIDRMSEYMPKGKFSITPFYIEACCELDIRTYTPSGSYTWIDIGRPASLARAREMAKSRD